MLRPRRRANNWQPRKTLRQKRNGHTWPRYALWPIALAHSIGNGTDSGRVWFLAFAGVCVLIVAAALVWRQRSNFTEYTDLEIFERT